MCVWTIASRTDCSLSLYLPRCEPCDAQFSGTIVGRSCAGRRIGAVGTHLNQRHMWLLAERVTRASCWRERDGAWQAALTSWLACSQSACTGSRR